MLLAFQEEVPGFAASRAIGALAGILIPSAILFKAIGGLSAKDVSRRCALSLAIASGGWALSSLAYALSLASSAFSAILMIVAVPSGLAVLGGMGLAIAGLVEVAGATRPIGGRGMAIGSLVIGGCFLIAGLVGFAMGERNEIPKEWETAQPVPGSKLFFGVKNYSYKVPSDGWVQLNAVKLNPLADLAFYHPKRKLFFIVIAQNLPAGSFATQDKLVAASRAELPKIDVNARVGESVPESVGPVQGTAFSVDARANVIALNYRYWVHSSGTRVYQMVTWGPQASATQVMQDSSALLKGFELLGP